MDTEGGMSYALRLAQINLTEEESAFVEAYLQYGDVETTCLMLNRPLPDWYDGHCLRGKEAERIRRAVVIRASQIREGTPRSEWPDWIERQYREIQGERRPTRGHIYFLRADNGLVKIGKSRNVAHRVEALSTGLPYDLELLCVLPTNDPSGTELSWHNRFAAHRIRGEWFRIADAEIEALLEETRPVNEASRYRRRR